MAGRSKAERRRDVWEALREANVGCLLLFVVGLGLPFVVVGGIFVGLGLRGALEQARLNAVTERVPATIVASDSYGSATRTSPGTGGTTTSYYVDVEFEYDYEGKTRRSNRVWPVGEGGEASEMRRVAQRYPAGAEVMAFVDPDRPDVAFLEKRWSLLTYLAVYVGLLPLSFVTLIAVVLAGWRRPGVALVFAVGAGIVVAGIGGGAAAHYLQEVPAPARAGWMWLVFAGGALMAAGPPLGVIKARQLHRIFVSEAPGEDVAE